jgi:hypothetical protein
MNYSYSIISDTTVSSSLKSAQLGYFINEDFCDWKGYTANLSGTDAEAYLETGHMTFGNFSRMKYAPWITIDFTRTEISISATISLYPYDDYLEGSIPQDGGPSLHYWWKMQYSGSEINYGSRGSATATLSFHGSVANYSHSQSAIVMNTMDAKAIYFNGSNSGLRYMTDLFWPYTQDHVLVGTKLSVGGWYNFTGASVGTDLTDEQRIFTQNLGGAQGYYRGLILHIPATPVGGLQLIMGWGNPTYWGSGVNSPRRYSTVDSNINWASTNFVAMTVEILDSDQLNRISATGSPSHIYYKTPESNLDIKIYINGVEQTMYLESTGTGSQVTIAFPMSSDVNGWKGMGFESPGDLIGSSYPQGWRDELFVHYDILTPTQILRMYNRGIGT